MAQELQLVQEDNSVEQIISRMKREREEKASKVQQEKQLQKRRQDHLTEV